MKILKFGGTSADEVDKVAQIIIDEHKDAREREDRIAVVCSAFAGVTNMLLEAADASISDNGGYEGALDKVRQKHFHKVNSLFPHNYWKRLQIMKEVKAVVHQLDFILSACATLHTLPPSTRDEILSFGERLSNYIISEYLSFLGSDAEYCNASSLVLTDDNHGDAQILPEETKQRIKEHFARRQSIQIITGFIGSTKEGVITTFGRGGSDLTATVFGEALGAEEVQLWKEVDGIHTADPREVPHARPIPKLSDKEAAEFTHFGATIVHPRAIRAANGTSVRIKNTFNPDHPGSVIHASSAAENGPVTGISSIPNISLLNLEGESLRGVPGSSERLFGCLAKAGVNIILICQASSEHSICFAIKPEDTEKARKVIEEEFKLEIQTGGVEPVNVQKDHSVIAIIGERMIETPGVSAQFLSAIADIGANIEAIAQGASERNVSVVVKGHDRVRALNAAHDSFFTDYKKLHLYIVGAGLIGSTLTRQIEEQRDLIRERVGLDLKIVAIADIDGMQIDERGLDKDSWSKGEKQKSDLDELFGAMKGHHLPGQILVDCTASQHVADESVKIIKNKASSVAVVTPNKKAASGPMKDFEALRRAVRGGHFFNETNVGAGVEILAAVRNLVDTGDQIKKIECIPSGTLAYIFGEFDKGRNFSEIVKEAQELGYTEPDPRDDLNGLDMARKILILAREAGAELELDDVQIENPISQECFSAESIEAFMEALAGEDEALAKLREEAQAKGKVLRFIASFEQGQAKVSLKEVEATSPFANIQGSNNVFVITSERYPDSKTLIGAGAGAEVTAAGVLADILAAGRRA